MQITRTHRLATAALAIAIALVGGAAACGDDDADAAGVSDEACAATTDYTAVLSGMPEDPAEMGAYVEDEVAPVVTTIVEGLPDDVDASALTDALGEVAETGDPSPLFEDPEVAEAQEAVGAAVHEGCDFGTIDVEAAEYSFDGVPKEIEAGGTSIRFENTGEEEHELVLFKLAEGVEPDADALLALPEEEQMEQMQFAGVTFGAPGATSYAALDLEAGDYLAVCFIPVGGEEDGAPHFTHGMHATFTVTE